MKNKKWIIIICSIVLLLVLNILVEKQNLFKRAIVVGIGVDKNEDVYSITIEYLDKDKSVFQTFECDKLEKLDDDFFKATGKKLSLSQSILLIVNKDLIDDAIFEYLLKDESIGSHLLLVLSENCKSLMESKIKVDTSVCSLIRDVVYKSKDKVELKDYFIAKKGDIKINIPVVNIENENVEIIYSIAI